MVTKGGLERVIALNRQDDHIKEKTKAETRV